MKLRYRGADSTNGLTFEETAFYLPETGKDQWVHVGCNPCYWNDGLDQEGNELTYPALRSMTTEWAGKIVEEFRESYGSSNISDRMISDFCLKKGYPKRSS